MSKQNKEKKIKEIHIGNDTINICFDDDVTGYSYIEINGQKFIPMNEAFITSKNPKDEQISVHGCLETLYKLLGGR